MSGLVKLPLVIVVNPSVPAKTLPEFIAYAKANPGKINYASVGSGATTNVAGELFKQMAGVDIVNVPYAQLYSRSARRSGAGRLHAGPAMSVSSGPASCARSRSPARRSAVLPGVPKAGVTCRATKLCVGCDRRAGEYTAPIIDTLNKAINAVLADPAMKASSPISAPSR